MPMWSYACGPPITNAAMMSLMKELCDNGGALKHAGTAFKLLCTHVWAEVSSAVPTSWERLGSNISRGKSSLDEKSVGDLLDGRDPICMQRVAQVEL